jgi:hypothetical protein
MKAFKSLWFQAILSLALMAGIWQMRQRMPWVDTSGSPEAAEVVPVSDPPRPTTPSQPRHDWAQVESDDYRVYVRNLRASGFPEDLVREIVIADLDALYAPLEDPLKFQMPAPDAPRSERNMTFSEEDWANLFRLRELRIEKQQALKEILGIYVPRELLRGPRSRNYEAYEYALGLLPEAKRDAAQLIIEQEIIADARNHERYHGADEVEAYRRSTEERNVALLEILTPEEFDLYHRHTTPAGTELARQIIGMEPTDEEFRIMFQHAYEAWIAAGGVYGRWRAVPVPPQQIQAAEAKMQEQFREALGEARYLDYQMAIHPTGQQLRNFGARYHLPHETMATVFQPAREAAQIESAMNRAQAQRDPAGAARFEARLAELRQHVELALGPELYATWTANAGLRPSLEP